MKTLLSIIFIFFIFVGTQLKDSYSKANSYYRLEVEKANVSDTIKCKHYDSHQLKGYNCTYHNGIVPFLNFRKMKIKKISMIKN